MKTLILSGLLFFSILLIDIFIFIPLLLVTNYYSLGFLFGFIIIYLTIAAIVLNIKILEKVTENTFYSFLYSFLLPISLFIICCFYMEDYPHYIFYSENGKQGIKHWPTNIKFSEPIYDNISEKIRVVSDATYMFDIYEQKGDIEYSKEFVFLTKVSGQTGIRNIYKEILPPVYDSIQIRSLPVENPYSKKKVSCDFIITYLPNKCDTLSFNNNPYPILIPYKKYDTTPIDW